MSKCLRFAAAAVLVLLSSGASLLGAAPVNDIVLVGDISAAWQEAVNELDAHVLLGLYGRGAVVMAGGEAPRLGRSEILEWYRRWNATADAYYDYRPVSLTIMNGHAVEEWIAYVTVTPRGAGGIPIDDDPLQFVQRGVRVYRKEPSGHWTIDRETWMSDPRPAARLAVGSVR